MIPFGPFAPDIQDFNVEVCVAAKNVIPTANGYRPVKSFSQAASWSAATGSIFSAIHHAYPTIYADPQIVAIGRNGIDMKLWVDGNDFTKASLTEATVGEDNFTAHGSFLQWDDNLLIFGPFAPQQIDKAGLLTNGVTKSSDIGGSPPIAQYAAVVRQQVVAGFLEESSVQYRNRLRWSAFGDYEGWTNGTNQAGQEDLQGGGAITGIVGGEYGLVFQENRITRMNYIGSPDVWEFDPISINVGSIAPQSIVQVGNDVYFYGNDGFYILREGSTIERIGTGFVDQWFKSQARGTISSLPELLFRYRLHGAYDESSSCIWWGYREVGTTPADYMNRCLVYHTGFKKWSVIEDFEASCIFPMLPALDGSDITIEPDRIGLFNYDGSAQNDPYKMTGAKMAGVLETGRIFDENKKTYVESIRPHIDGECTMALLYHIADAEDSETETSAVTKDIHGKCDFDVEGRYFRVRLTTQGSAWEEVVGFTPTQREAGEY